MALTGRVWPNGEFGLAPKRKLQSENHHVSLENTPDRPLTWTLGEAPTLKAYLAWSGGLFLGMEKIAPGFMREVYRESLEPLGLSSVPKNHKRAKRGTKGITSYGRRMLRNGAWLLARRVRKYGMAMLTMTIPALPEEEYRAVVNSWSEIMRQYLQWMHRKLRAAGACPWVVGCCEVQEGRMREAGGLPLHAHLLFSSRVGNRFVFSPADMRNKWAEIVCRVSGIDTDRDFSASCRLETVRKNAENYISKYASKGCSASVLAAVPKGFELPKTWWYAAGGFKKYVKKMTRILSMEEAQRLRDAIGSTDVLFRFVGAIIPCPDVTTHPAGWYGRLNRIGWDWVFKVS